MTPYIVTVSQQAWTERDECGEVYHAAHVLSRRAVATLNEARGEIEEIVDVCTGEAVAAEIPDLGPIRVGPLSDGTVIEVEPTTGYEMAVVIEGQRPPSKAILGETDAAIIAAYNAVQAETKDPA